MKNLPWLKPSIVGGVVGAAAIAIAGFAWGGWHTTSAAEKLARDRAKQEVIAALVPICIHQAQLDPDNAQKMSELADSRSYQRNTYVIQTGWATMPGTSEPNKEVARACALALTTPS